MRRLFHKKQKFLLFFCFVFFLFLKASSYAFASNTVVLLKPQSGLYPLNVPFSADLIIDGHGDQFNAAKATVVVSSNLQVQNLTLGNCNFAFISTPSLVNPSFIGVILGGFSTYCTLYTMIINPVSPGTGTITLNNTEVKQYGTGNDLLIGLTNANYSLGSNGGSGGITITPNFNTPTPNFTGTPYQYPLPTPTPAPPDSITIQAISANNMPLAGVTVLLDPPQPTATIVQQVTLPTTSPTRIPYNQLAYSQIPAQAPVTASTDVRGMAVFTHVPEGLHKIVVEQGGQPISQNILMVNGKQPVNLGIKAPLPNTLLRDLSIAAIAIIVILIIAYFIIRYTPLIIFVKDKLQSFTRKAEPPNPV